MAFEGIPILAITGFFTIAAGLVVLLMGYQSGRSGNYKDHRRMMISAVIILAAFLVQYIVRAVILRQETHFEGPEWIKLWIYIPVLVVHITFAIITIVLIVRHLTKSLKNEQRTSDGQIYFPKEYRGKHRRLGLITFGLWMFSYLGGIIIFVLLYILEFNAGIEALQ